MELRHMLEGKLKGTFDENYSLYQYLPGELRQKFYDLLLYCYEYTERLWYLNRCPELTDYGRSHAERVMRMLTKILEPKFKENYQFLNSYELYFLLCAVLLHDIGISIPNMRDCEKIRENHGYYSALRISSEHDIPIGDKEIRDIVGGICKYHQLRAPISEHALKWLKEQNIEPMEVNGEYMTPIDDVHTYKSPNGNVKVRTRFLASLLRIANACDVEFDSRMAQFYEFRTTENLSRLNENKKKIEKIRNTIQSIEGKIQFIENLEDRCHAISKCKLKNSEKRRKCKRCIWRNTDLSIDKNLIIELNSEMTRLERQNRFLLRQAHRYRTHQSVNEVYLENDRIVLEPVLNPKPGWKDELRETRRNLLLHLESVKPTLAENGIVINDIEIEGLAVKSDFAKKIKTLYLIYKDGRMICSYPKDDNLNKYDSDIFSGMLTALHDFAGEIFQSKRSIGKIEYGENKILIEKGEMVYAAAVIEGEEPSYIRMGLNELVNEFEKRYKSELKEWSGDTEEFKFANEMLKGFVK